VPLLRARPRGHPKLARRQDRLEGIWGVVAFGCHPNRDTLARIEVAFEVDDVGRGERAAPKIVRPYVLGRASAGSAAVPRS